MYATTADMQSRFDHDGQLTQVCNGTLDVPFITQALTAAAGSIDTALRKRYTLPLSQVPALLVDVACDLAWWRLHHWRGLFDRLERGSALDVMYQNALRVLAGLADGSCALEGIENDEQPDEVWSQSSARLSSRHTLGRL